MVAGIRKGIAEFYEHRNTRHIRCQQSFQNVVEGRETCDKKFLKSLQRIAIHNANVNEVSAIKNL